MNILPFEDSEKRKNNEFVLAKKAPSKIYNSVNNTDGIFSWWYIDMPFTIIYRIMKHIILMKLLIFNVIQLIMLFFDTESISVIWVISSMFLGKTRLTLQ